jgi:2-dehydro-3-deoxygalactonokinase
MTARAIVGVDWGSTNLRAFRFDPDGGVVDVRRTESGARTLRGAAFEAVLKSVIEDWLDEGASRVITCGMAGGREGWLEAPYAPCPCDMRALARNVIRAPARFAEIWIAPGAKSLRDDGRVEVMRGEETQILGGLEDERGPALVIAPGTHSKWVQVEAGRLIGFRTYMTGELFALLKEHSILGRTMNANAKHDDQAFELGVHRAIEDKGLLNLVFSTRTEVLFEHLSPEAAPSYLSGILLGAEIVEAMERTPFTADTPIFLVGDPALAKRYAQALAIAGHPGVRSLDGERAAARGLWRMAQEQAP